MDTITPTVIPAVVPALFPSVSLLVLGEVFSTFKHSCCPVFFRVFCPAGHFSQEILPSVSEKVSSGHGTQLRSSPRYCPAGQIIPLVGIEVGKEEAVGKEEGGLVALVGKGDEGLDVGGIVGLCVGGRNVGRGVGVHVGGRVGGIGVG